MYFAIGLSCMLSTIDLPVSRVVGVAGSSAGTDKACILLPRPCRSPCTYLAPSCTYLAIGLSCTLSTVDLLEGAGEHGEPTGLDLAWTLALVTVVAAVAVVDAGGVAAATTAVTSNSAGCEGTAVVGTRGGIRLRVIDSGA